MNNGDPNLNTQEMNTETSPHWSITGSANCLPIGTRLAEFEITGVVGEGGFGNVYLAFDHSLQRAVAIKEYMPVALASRGADNVVLVQTKRHKETFEIGMNSFINEARLLAQFDHPALIKVYRFWEQNNTAYMAMRYYEGQTFKNIINKNPEIVTEAWLKPILKPILEALEVLYKIQILHRDISPDNIMIQTNGDAVLLDFGAARQILGDMTQALTVILKPGYAPVEQYAEDSDMTQGPWTDIYALSAVVYSAIIRKAPPTSVTRLLKDPIELLQATPRAGFSKDFLAAIDRGMAVKPQDRPQSIAEFSKLLGIDKFGAAQPSTSPTAKSSSGQKKTDIKPVDPRDSQKSKTASGAKVSSGAKAGKASSKKVSNKGSWILVIAGVLAAATGIYRMSHRDVEPKVATGTALTTNANSNANELGNASQTSAPISVAANGPNEKAEVMKEAADHAKSPSASRQSASLAPAIATKQLPAPIENPSAQKSAVTSTLAQNTPVSPATTVLPAAAATTAQATPDAGQVDADAAKANAVFRLSIRPWATVMVDGVTKGVSPPLKRLLLSDGKHQIRLVNPNFPDHTVDILVNSKKKFGVIDYEFSSR
jgi:serine/threonine protein kinase